MKYVMKRENELKFSSTFKMSNNKNRRNCVYGTLNGKLHSTMRPNTCILEHIYFGKRESRNALAITCISMCSKCSKRNTNCECKRVDKASSAVAVAASTAAVDVASDAAAAVADVAYYFIAW